MISPNVSRVLEYLNSFEAMGAFESVANLCTHDVTAQVFPNRIAPHGHIRRGDELRTTFEQGRKYMKSQRYEVQNILEAGDQVAVEVEWTGILAVPVMNLPAGSEMKAFFAMFLTFRDGKNSVQRNYDCYPPFDSQQDPKASSRI